MGKWLEEETNQTEKARDAEKQQESISTLPKQDFLCNSPEDTKKIAEYFAKLSRPGLCFALYGTLGSGKTTFSQFLIKALIPSVEHVSSPTFTVVQTYEGISKNLKYENGRNNTSPLTALPHSLATPSAYSQPLQIRHVDCYRLENPEEFFELGLEETFESCITIIEWPEIIEDFLPRDTIKLQFKILEENVRMISKK